MISQSNPEIISSLLVLSNSIKPYQHLVHLLANYFTLVQQQYLFIDNKYYKTFIKLVYQTWPQHSELNKFKQSHVQLNSEVKYDLLIMLVHEDQSYQASMYDYAISKYNPQNFILIYDTKDKTKQWQDQSMISNQVNNFIEIIKQNLEVISKQPPQIVNKGLLQDNYEDGHIFNLIELIETTPWSSIQRKPYVKTIKQNNVETKIQCQKQDNIATSQPQIKVQPYNEQNEYVQDEQSMQKQMMIFQNLISEMKNMKTLAKQSQGVPDSERKKKAESLISKLLGGGIFQQ